MAVVEILRRHRLSITDVGMVIGSVDLFPGTPATRWDPGEPPEVEAAKLTDFSGAEIDLDPIFEDEIKLAELEMAVWEIYMEGMDFGP